MHIAQRFGAGKRGGGCSGQQGDPGTGCGARESGLKAEQGQTARGDCLKIIITYITINIDDHDHNYNHNHNNHDMIILKVTMINNNNKYQ